MADYRAYGYGDQQGMAGGYGQPPPDLVRAYQMMGQAQQQRLPSPDDMRTRFAGGAMGSGGQGGWQPGQPLPAPPPRRQPQASSGQPGWQPGQPLPPPMQLSPEMLAQLGQAQGQSRMMPPSDFRAAGPPAGPMPDLGNFRGGSSGSMAGWQPGQPLPQAYPSAIPAGPLGGPPPELPPDVLAMLQQRYGRMMPPR